MGFEKREIVVVGAGVIGLSIAHELAEANYKVIVIASHFPTDPLSSRYTSSWAGAHFRPFPLVQPHDKRERLYSLVTLEKFTRMSQQEPESSIRMIKGIEYLEDPSKEYIMDSGYSDGIKDFRKLSKYELPDEDVKLGTEYETWCVNAPHYLLYLYNKLKFKYGVEFVKQELNCLKQVFYFYPNISGIVNATAFGLQYDGSYDPLCYPIRGQTLLIRAPLNKQCRYENQTITRQTKDGKWSFIIPRPINGGIILGGTKQLDILDTKPRLQDTEQLIELGKKFFPELLIENPNTGEKFFDIQHINVGFRPARKSGSRVELEKIIDNERNLNKFIVHAYGVGGMGYEVSFGIASKVVSLVEAGRLSKL
ncbi:hypothetical protein PACTADRAFT_84996 [Pachysolen tannophilus NRRL Y-2460]|uniref:FAD dependent oxidoreductase domain-containing protein n=1 Tax=Pachysolen tannophilus NRRL Y-2460 TaxID=669874 RepID=A0A1E4TWS2_PACTA|nr:hypothetical protein PACTADRAFT_84996 [Pachysolen tannophilus NRRL Y-2460]